MSKMHRSKAQQNKSITFWDGYFYESIRYKNNELSFGFGIWIPKTYNSKSYVRVF